MNNLMKPYAIFSKQLLLDLCKSKYKSHSELSLQPEYKDYTKCSKQCPFYYENRAVCASCKNCPFVLSHRFDKIERKEYLTFTQIKQLLLYHTILFEKNGLTPYVNHEFVASNIGCTVKTARENVKALEKAHYITAKYYGKDYVVIVEKYSKYHESERGYFKINAKVMSYLLKIENINELRLALYCLVRLDDMKASIKYEKNSTKKTKNNRLNNTIKTLDKNILKNKNENIYRNARNNNILVKKFSYSALLDILPSYVYTKKQLKELLTNLSKNLNIFNILFDKDEIIMFETNANNKLFKKVLNKKNNKFLKFFIKKYNLELEEKDIEDLNQMQTQYNNSLVKYALKVYNIRKESINIDNICGYIRSIIQDTILSTKFLIDNSLPVISNIMA